MIPATKAAEAGKPFTPSAAAWNEFINTANRSQLESVSSSSGKTGGAWGQPCTVAIIKNSTVSDLTAGSVLSPILATASAATFPDNPHETRRRPVLYCSAPTGTISPVVVLIDPIGAGKYGRAASAGITVCKVNIQSTSHRYAAAALNTTANLVSAGAGTVRMVHQASTTGTQECLVLLLGCYESPQKLVRCTSNTVTSSMQPGVLVEPDGVGGRADGATVKMKCTVGDKFRSGGTYWLQLNGFDGTTEIYDGIGSTSWTRPVCREGVEVNDRAWFYGWFENEENV